MTRDDAKQGPLPKGVTRLDRDRGGRAYRATIRKGKGVRVHLGLYETPWLAGFAYSRAAAELGRESPPLSPPAAEQPTAEEVRTISGRVRARLGIDRAPTTARPFPPTAEELLVFFEVTVVGFWRTQAAADHGGPPQEGLDAAAGRLADAARLLFWSPAAGHPDPLLAMSELLSRRLDREFGRKELAREILDDDGDEAWRVARWLAHPDRAAGDRFRGFRAEVVYRYPDAFESQEIDGDGSPPRWAEVLGMTPPYTVDRARAAYRARSLSAHPDGGGTQGAFIRLRAAFEEAMAYCAARG